jgi:type I restriction enzyme S subunit
MIAKLEHYPVMRDSDVPWLGEVPVHWEVTRLCAIARTKSITGTENRELLSVYLDRGVIRFSEIGDKRTNVTSEDLSKYQAVDPGDFVLNNQQAWRGSVGVSRHVGIVSPAYVVLSLDARIDPEYANLLFRERIMIDQYLICSRGVGTIQRNLYWPSLRRVLILLPPLPEQRAIVRFLNHADRRVQRYIRGKQKLIKLLEEKKQAIIQRAVTRGLDPDARLKASGVEWMGDVPEHWSQLTLGRCLRHIEQGWSPIATEGNPRPDQWAVLTLSSVKGGKFNGSAIKPISPATAFLENIEIRDGDLLLTRSNTRELVGDVCIAKGVRPKTIIPDLIYRLVTDTALVSSTFLMFQLLSPCGRTQIERDARGSSNTMPKISQRHIRSWRITVPPLPEQQMIVAAIMETTRKLEQAVERAKAEIALVGEFQTRLIADVVTGKRDVRETAASLADEAGVLGELEDENNEDESMTGGLGEALEEVMA